MDTGDNGQHMVKGSIFERFLPQLSREESTQNMQCNII